MKKEKKVRAYTRKVNGKTVSVKAHTQKYDAAEEARKAFAKKAGAGEELASKKLTANELKQVKSIVEENSELDEQYVAAFYPELSPRMVKAVMAEYRKKSATPKAKAANTAGKTPKAKAEKSSAPDLGFTADEYKAWYHWDTENDPKNKAAMKVKKALLGAMGPRAYKKYEEDMTNSYSSKGHSKAYGTLPELVQARKDARNARIMEKTAKAQKAIAENYGATEAAAKHGKRAKSEGEKRKEATAKIKELSPKKSQTKVKELNLGGHSYFVWKDSDGSFKGSRQNPTSRVMDANSIARFTYDQGFKSIKDVEGYLKAPYTKGKKKK